MQSLVAGGRPRTSPLGKRRSRALRSCAGRTSTRGPRTSAEIRACPGSRLATSAKPRTRTPPRAERDEGDLHRAQGGRGRRARSRGMRHLQHAGNGTCDGTSRAIRSTRQLAGKRRPLVFSVLVCGSWVQASDGEMYTQCSILSLHPDKRNRACDAAS
eukprot:scaffold2963_cov250-Pinguiococcus_pyrenoidosus.AAC.13